MRTVFVANVHNLDYITPVPYNNKATNCSFLPVHLDLPVGLSCDVNIVQISGVVLRVCPTQDQLSSHCCFRVPTTEAELAGLQKRKPPAVGLGVKTKTF